MSREKFYQLLHYAIKTAGPGNRLSPEQELFYQEAFAKDWEGAAKALEGIIKDAIPRVYVPTIGQIKEAIEGPKNDLSEGIVSRLHLLIRSCGASSYGYQEAQRQMSPELEELIQKIGGWTYIASLDFATKRNVVKSMVRQALLDFPHLAKETKRIEAPQSPQQTPPPPQPQKTKRDPGAHYIGIGELHFPDYSMIPKEWLAGKGINDMPALKDKWLATNGQQGGRKL